MSTRWLLVFWNKRVKTTDEKVVDTKQVDVKTAILSSHAKAATENNVCLTRQDYRDGIIVLHCSECGCQRKFKPLRKARNQRRVNRNKTGKFYQKNYECAVCGVEIWF